MDIVEANELKPLPTPQAPQLNGNGHHPVSQPEAGQVNVGEIDRIRDIIFGSQQRDIERGFKLVERRIETLSGTIHDLAVRQEQDKSELDSRLNLLEEKMRREVHAIEAHLQENRREVFDKLAAMERSFNERLSRLEQALTEQVDSLGESKVDRFDLGDLLMETALRLRKDKSSNPMVQG